MTLQEIKDAVAQGKKVCWKNNAYEVRQWKIGLSIVCIHNNNGVGLTWTDEVTLNGKEEDFFIAE